MYDVDVYIRRGLGSSISMGAEREQNDISVEGPLPDRNFDDARKHVDGSRFVSGRVGDVVTKWLKEVEKFGFLYTAGEAEDEVQDDCGLQDQGKPSLPTFRVCDPFCLREIGDRDRLKILSEEGEDLSKNDSIANLKGQYAVHVTLNEIDGEFVLTGKWRKGRREGRGSVSGPGLERNYGVRDVVGNYRRGKLQGQAKVFFPDGAGLSGFFAGGCLTGPAHGIDPDGNLTFTGNFAHGYPVGHFWKMLPGDGCLYGRLDSLGKFTGADVAYIYPDKETSLKGEFDDGQLVRAIEQTIVGTSQPRPTEVLQLTFSTPDDGPVFQHWPSNLEDISCPPLLEDPYERKHVTVRDSLMPGAGDGLFAATNIVAGAAVAFYNGIRVRPGETPPFRSRSYEICVDWNTEPGKEGEYMDIPEKYRSIDAYRATVGHKINHSFTPNCVWGNMLHPVFGRIPSITALTDIKTGEELTCHYRYDMRDACKIPELQWYVAQWDALSKKCNEAVDLDGDKEKKSADDATEPTEEEQLRFEERDVCSSTSNQYNLLHTTKEFNSALEEGKGEASRSPTPSTVYKSRSITAASLNEDPRNAQELENTAEQETDFHVPRTSESGENKTDKRSR